MASAARLPSPVPGRLSRYLAIPVCCLVLSGCDVRLLDLSRDMRDLRGTLAEMTGAETVSIKVPDNGTMTVDLANPPANASPPEQRETPARRVAGRALESYTYRKRLNTFNVTFMAHRHRFVFLTVSREVDTFAFDVAEGEAIALRNGGGEAPAP